MNIPYGYCRCGCGEKTSLASQGHTAKGYVKGEPVRFLVGHHRRKGPLDYIVDEHGCWIWQRTLDSKGYGVLRRSGIAHQAHRWYWEQEHGAVPDGLEMDHLCRVRACVNPDHLEPVTHAENIRRRRRP
jgi:hypothetical protein